MLTTELLTLLQNRGEIKQCSQNRGGWESRSVATISFSIIGLIRKGSMDGKACKSLSAVKMRFIVKSEYGACSNMSVIPGHRQTDHRSLEKLHKLELVHLDGSEGTLYGGSIQYLCRNLCPGIAILKGGGINILSFVFFFLRKVVNKKKK